MCVCVQRGQPPFQREEITLDLPDSSGDTARPGEKNQNSNQKVKARKDTFCGGDFCFVLLVCFFLFGWRFFSLLFFGCYCSCFFVVLGFFKGVQVPFFPPFSHLGRLLHIVPLP